MTTWFARFSNAPSLQPGGVDRGVIPSARNWPYLRFWQEKWSGVRGGAAEAVAAVTTGREGDAKRVSDVPATSAVSAEDVDEDERRRRRKEKRGRSARIPSCPLLYMYGADKPARFHGDRWLEDVRASGGQVVEVKGAGHWFQVTHADQVNEVLIRWLEDTAELRTSGVPQHRSAL